MRFVDYKCKDCEEITEIVFRGENGSKVACEKCGSKSMIKIFAPIGFKSSSNGDSEPSGQSSGGGCSSGSCASCSGCS